MLIVPTPQRPGCVLVFVTAPDVETARRLGRTAVELRLAACANLIPNIESHYWWEGKVESAAEFFILFKTTPPKVNDLKAFIREQHPYTTPEFLGVNADYGSEQYLQWLFSSVATTS